MSDLGFSIAGSGLQAARAAMDATANNLANVNTPGYLDEQAQVIAAPSGDPLGIGTGAQILGITQASDAVLAANALSATSTSSNLNALQQTLSTVQAVFPEPGTNGLSAQLSTFWSSWDAIVSDPSQTAPRTEVINQAQNLAATLNQESAQLSQTAANTATQITATVSQVNTELAQVASLNQSIVSSIASGAPPNSLIDQRNAIVTQLGHDIGVTTRAQADGALDLYVGGLTLVQSANADSLSVNQGGNPVNTSIVSTTSGAQAPVSSGALAGLLATVNKYIPTYQSQLDGVANDLATTVNDQLAAGYDAAGMSGASNPLFTPNGGTAGGTVTAATIGVNANVVADPQLIAAASAGAYATGAEANDGSNAQAVAALATSATGPDQAYRTFITNLGSDVQSVTSQSQAQTSLSQSLQATLQSVTGVNTDQQTVDMLSYQQAYQASAKVISTIDTMVQSLLAAV